MGKYEIGVGGMTCMRIIEKGTENTMESDLFEKDQTIFVEDEKYLLSKYEVSDHDLFFKVWVDVFEDSIVEMCN